MVTDFVRLPGYGIVNIFIHQGMVENMITVLPCVMFTNSP